MPDPKMLYAVTAIVFAALAAWVFVVFRNVKEPWARPIGDLPDDATPAATPKAKKGAEVEKPAPAKMADEAKVEPKKAAKVAAARDEEEDDEDDEEKKP